jgi:exosortase
VWERLVVFWSNSDEYSHGFLIVPLSAYIVWRKRDVLAEIGVKSSWIGLAVAILALMLYLFSHFAEIMTLTSLSMVLFLAGAVTYFYGGLMLKELLFPLFLLLFMIPIPSQVYAYLTVPLQLFVSKASVGIAQILDIPVHREGNVIHLPARTLQVVQACSGMRSMISLLTLSAVFGYLTLKSNLLRSILFVSGVPAAIIVNIIRVLLLVGAFYYFGYDLTEGSVHTAFGVVIFGLALIILFALRGVLSSWDRSKNEK